MGYRSNLVALIYPDTETREIDDERYAQLKVLMATTFKATIDGTEGVDGFASCMTGHDDERVLKFQLADVKWYPSYPDVMLFSRMLGMFEEGHEDVIKGYCTEFIRIGEESDDVDEEHTGENNQYYLHVRREIDCNV